MMSGDERPWMSGGGGGSDEEDDDDDDDATTMRWCSGKSPISAGRVPAPPSLRNGLRPFKRVYTHTRTDILIRSSPRVRACATYCTPPAGGPHPSPRTASASSISCPGLGDSQQSVRDDPVLAVWWSSPVIASWPSTARTRRTHPHLISL